MQESPQGPSEPEQPTGQPEADPGAAKEAQETSEPSNTGQQPPVPGTEVAPDPVSTGTGPDDMAPDADEPGDDLPSDLEEHAHVGPIVPDEVDQKDVQK